MTAKKFNPVKIKLDFRPLEKKPCPCGDKRCVKFIVPPLINCVDASLYEYEADELIRRWNGVQDGTLVDPRKLPDDVLLAVLLGRAFSRAGKKEYDAIVAGFNSGRKS